MAIMVIVVLFGALFLLAYQLGNIVSGSVIRYFSYPQHEPNKANEKIDTPNIFFKTVFSLLGYIAKSDGRVNSMEIKFTEKYMAQISLTDEQKQEAISLFKMGAMRQFSLHQAIGQFLIVANHNPNMTEILLVYLVSLARTDGLLVPPELYVVREVAQGLGFSSITFEHLLRMISSQEKFDDRRREESGTYHNRRSQTNEHKAYTTEESANRQQTASPDDIYVDEMLLAAYAALGVGAHVNNDELKQAYRKLAGQYHPDKLMGQGMPDFMITAAADRFRKIQSAYDYIKRARTGL